MNKRLLSIFTALILLCLLIPSGVSAGTSSEKLINGGFETVSEGAPSGWNPIGGSYGTGLKIDTADPFEGNNALKMSGSTNIYVSRGMTLLSKTEYFFEAWLKIESLSNGGKAAFKFEFATAGGGSEVPTQEITDLNGGKWQRITYTFTTPENLTTTGILLRLLGGGTIYWDKVSVCNTELVSNGACESFSGWNTASNSDCLSIAGGYEGNAIMISNTDSSRNPYAAQSLTGIVGGTEYVIRGYFKGSAVSGGGPGIKLEMYESQGGSTNENTTNLGNSGVWKYFEYKVITPAATTRISLLLRLYGSGTACYDNVSVKRSGSRDKKLDLIPETIFYYTDNTVGKVTVGKIGDIPAGAKIYLKIKDGDSVINSYVFDNVQESNSISFQISDLKVEKKAYTVQTEYTTAGGTIIESASYSIYRYDRPTHLTAEGKFIDHDGNVVTPVIAYHFPYTDYKKAKEAGITVVQCAYTGGAIIKTVLDEAEKYGLKVLIPLYRNMKPAAHPDNIANTTNVVNTYKDHKALFGWMVMDEPRPDSDQMYEYLKQSYILIRELDSGSATQKSHPVYICECAASSYVQSGQCCDVLCIDPYPASLAAMPKRVYEATLKAKEAVNYKKPVYVVNQAWDWQGWEPSSNDIRHMKYQALFAGADGLGYYPVNDSDGTMWKLELWNGVVGFFDFEYPTAKAAFIDGQGTLSVNTASNDVHYAIYTYEGETYVAVLNRTANVQSSTIPVSAAGNVYDVNGCGESLVSWAAGKLSISLEPYQAACFKIASAFIDAAVWENNHRFYSLKSGEYEIRVTDGFSAYVALYSVKGDNIRMVSLDKKENNSTVSVTDETSMLKVFVWRDISSLQPLQRASWVSRY